jgi:hypothetical protein
MRDDLVPHRVATIDLQTLAIKATTILVITLRVNLKKCPIFIHWQARDTHVTGMQDIMSLRTTLRAMFAPPFASNVGDLRMQKHIELFMNKVTPISTVPITLQLVASLAPHVYLLVYTLAITQLTVVWLTQMDRQPHVDRGQDRNRSSYL